MIRCGAFCFTADRGLAEAAAKSARLMAAKGAKLRVRKGDELSLDANATILSLDYEGSGLPLVHGYRGDDGAGGEYSMLTRAEGKLEASRDYCGTRPLYLGTSGKWVATDHRFLQGETNELLTPRSVVRLRSWEHGATDLAHRRFEGSFDEAATKLAGLIRDSVKARVNGMRRVAVAFSGGLDSSIVAHCAAADTKVIACTVSTESSKDARVSEDAASVLGFESVSVRADEKRLREELSGLALPFEPSPMDRSLWCIYSMTARLASDSGAGLIMLGQLADELFGGYSKYETALRKDGPAEAGNMMSLDVASCGMRGFIRDEAACRRWCEPRFPFAEKELAMFGESLPVPYKIRNGVRKAVLRESARILGLPEEIVERPKKAAQYSSGVMKLLS